MQRSKYRLGIVLCLSTTLLTGCDGLLVRGTLGTDTDAMLPSNNNPEFSPDRQAPTVPGVDASASAASDNRSAVDSADEPTLPEPDAASSPKEPAAAAFSFFAVGDTRSNQDIAQLNFQNMSALDPKAIAVFNSGDLTADGKASQWQTHVDAVNLGSAGKIRMDLTDWSTDYIRYFGVVGNHDTHESDWRSSWNNFLSGQKALGNNDDKGVWFTVRYSNALFIVLDSENDDSAQTPWLEAVLADAAADPSIEWTFAFFHHPVYPCNYKSPNSGGIEWVRLFEKYGVDMVFNGHAHVYERTCPMVKGQCQDGGVVYVITGGGGAGTKSVDLSKTMSVGPDSYDCSKVVLTGKGNWHHYCRLTVNGRQLGYACYSHNSTTNPDDTMKMSK